MKKRIDPQTVISVVCLIPTFIVLFAAWITFTVSVIIITPLCIIPAIRRQESIRLPKADGTPNIEVSYYSVREMIRMNWERVPGFGSSLIDLFF